MTRDLATTPLDIPPGQAGDHHLCHQVFPAGTTLHTSTPRELLFGKPRAPSTPAHILLDRDTRFHRLGYSGGTWMTDHPIEQVQIGRLISRLRGHVLVAGLGLGLALALGRNNLAIDRMTVVEVSAEVRDLVWPHVQRFVPCELVLEDAFEFLRSARPGIYDSALLDTWQATGEHCFWNTVLPMRRLARRVVGRGPIECWAEDIMRGQLRWRLLTNLALLAIGELGSTKIEEWEERFLLTVACGKRVDSDDMMAAVRAYVDAIE